MNVISMMKERNHGGEKSCRSEAVTNGRGFTQKTAQNKTHEVAQALVCSSLLCSASCSVLLCSVLSPPARSL